MSNVTFNVNGMTCQGCAKAVTNALMSLEGIEQVDVNLENKQVVVSFDDAKKNVAELEVAITEAGYELF